MKTLTIGEIKLHRKLETHKVRMMHIMGNFNSSDFCNHMAELEKIASKGFAMEEVLSNIETEAARSGRVIYPD